MMQAINFQTGEMTGKVSLSDMPQHRFEPETLGKSLARTLPDFLVMIGLILVFFVGAYVSFLKYDVR
jgi:ABC-type transport system involved in multi-copper enzyme maturation permease subunit